MTTLWTKNTLKTVAFLGLLTGMLLGLGYTIGGQTGLWVGLALAGVMNVGSWWFADRVALAMGGAREMEPWEAPELHGMVRELAHRAGLPMPRLAMVESAAPNAFAAGRDPEHAVVAVTRGLLDLLTPREVAAVVCHELGHVANRDSLVMVVAATLGGAITMLAQMASWGFTLGSSDEEEGPSPLAGFLMLLVAPLAATLIQLAVSRTREYMADAYGARLHGEPGDLASALRKMEAWSRSTVLAVSPAAAHMFIVPPQTGWSVQSLFMTHPPTDDRIARLMAMRRQRGSTFKEVSLVC